ncbi:nucleobase:cation symporter-2 family protein [Herbaspirillum camelliae]|uniref:nucleobase:cation symporter-2 family protein n=1 Tax=Herbaspirillum camelliae TaxID=1892903 RepID=UPI000A51FD1A|nr:nucleobase:cation symporter-2 family protein [Herbaspirillum camelliae]
MNTLDSTLESVRPLRLILLAIQHVLVMYAGAIATPLIIGAALNLPKEQIAYLINADLMAGGLVTLVQTVGWRGFGIRLPIMMGVTFTAIGPMIAIGSNPEMGLQGVYGATIAAGLFGLIVAPFVGKLLRFFPPIVTGIEILLVGLSLMGVAATWAGGGYGSADFGGLLNLAIAGSVLLFVLLLVRKDRGMLSSLSILLALIFGVLLSLALGKVSFDGLADAPWIGVITPLHFGMPTISFWGVAAMCVVMLVTFIESTGMFLAVGEIVGKPVSQRDLVRGFRADSIGNVIGGFFNTFPYTSFAQNVGLVAMTGVRSRWVCAVGGIILILLGMLPKLAVVVASVPPSVLGGAGIVMFGMVAASGVRTLTKVDLSRHQNLYIIAISVGVGMLPVVSEKFFSKMPGAIAPILSSSILLAAITAVILNLFFNGVGSTQEAEKAALETARTETI